MTRQEALERRDWVIYNLGGEREKATHWTRMPEGPEET